MTPVLFIGHGHPLNAIQRNAFTAALKRAAADLPRPDQSDGAAARERGADSLGQVLVDVGEGERHAFGMADRHPARPVGLG